MQNIGRFLCTNIQGEKMSLIKIKLLCLIFLFAIYAKGENKIISLTPALTELIVHLGGAENLIARSSACDYPIEIKKLPIAGAFGKPNLEQLILLNPNIIVSSTLKDKGIINSIENLGIKFYLIKMESFEDYYNAVTQMGIILDCKNKANLEIKRIKSRLSEYKQNNDKILPKVYLEIWDKPYMTIGNKSFINELISYAGGKNIASNLNKAYFNCSVEWIISSNPDIIICPAMKKNRITSVLSRDGWGNIEAVKNKRIITELDDDLIYRLGPRVLDGIDILKKYIK